MLSNKSDCRHAPSLNFNYRFHFGARQCTLMEFQKIINPIRYQIIFIFAHDVSNNSISYSHGTVCMIITRKVFWKRGWQRRYQLHVQDIFSELLRNSISMTVTSWYIMNIAHNPSGWHDWYASYEMEQNNRVYLNMVIVKETTVGIN